MPLNEAHNPGEVITADDMNDLAALVNDLDTDALRTSAAPELIRDTIGTALVAGSNVTITVNDGSDTITIASTGGGGGGTPVAVACRVYRNGSGMSIPHATFTAIAFDAETFDTDGFHSTVTNTTRVVAPVAGKYQANGTVRWGAQITGGNYRGIGIRQYTSAGAVVRDAETYSTGSNGQLDGHSLSDIFNLAAGDYLELRAYQESGSSKAIQQGQENTFLSVALLGT